jgi:hypothetical protein
VSVNESNPLYEACVGFMVAEKSEADSWEKVARFVQTKVDNGSGDEAQLKAEFSVVEKQIKKDFSVTTLPTAWRTAKSTAMSAARAEVSLLDDTGTVKGKSGIEDEVRGKKLGTDVPTLVEKIVADLSNSASRMTGLRITSLDMLLLDAAVESVNYARRTCVDA